VTRPYPAIVTDGAEPASRAYARTGGLTTPTRARIHHAPVGGGSSVSLAYPQFGAPDLRCSQALLAPIWPQRPDLLNRLGTSARSLGGLVLGGIPQELEREPDIARLGGETRMTLTGVGFPKARSAPPVGRWRSTSSRRTWKPWPT
jgi:hypothetical protein